MLRGVLRNNVILTIFTNCKEADGSRSKPNLSDGTNCKEADGSRLKPNLSEGTNCNEVDGLRSEPSLSDCCDAETFNAEKYSHQNSSASGMSTNKNHNTHSMDSVGNEGAVKPVSIAVTNRTYKFCSATNSGANNTLYNVVKNTT